MGSTMSEGVLLDPSTKDYLERMSRGTNDRCFQCGQSGHFADRQTTTKVTDVDEWDIKSLTKTVNPSRRAFVLEVVDQGI